MWSKKGGRVQEKGDWMDWISRKRFITVMIFSACGFSWMWKIGELGGLAAGGIR